MTAATPEPSHVPPNGQGPTGDGPAGCDPIRLAGMLSELSRSVEAEDDTETLLDDLVAAGVAQIPGVDEGSISLVLQRRQAPRERVR